MSNVETTVEILDVTPVRVQVATEINALLDTIGTSYIQIGNLLTEARGDFENQKEFLEWADDSFGIKKAQCYNLMNVARVFSDRPEFSGVAMRVMLQLVPFADDGELMDRAADLANVGELDTAACNQLLGKPAKGAVSPAVQAVKQAIAAAQAEPKPEAMQVVPEAAQVDAGDDETMPWDSDEYTDAAPANLIHTMDGAQQFNAVQQAATDAVSAGIMEELKRLREDNAALNARILELTATRETKKASAPMLPQFKSKCLYARLGLSVEQSMSLAAVNKAKRELVKLGYGEGHDAWPLIQEAVAQLGK